MTFFARVVSVLFHPLLMATYLYALLALALPSALAPLQTDAHWTFILLIFIVTFVLPLLCMGIFRTFGTISSFMMADRRERIVPFLFITAIYVAVTYLFYTKTRLSPDDNFLKLLMIIDMLVIVATIVTFFFKVSLHSVGIWGLIGIIVPLTKIAELNVLMYCAVGLIVLAGIIMSSRLQLGAHTPREVIWGGIIGLATSVAGMLILF